MFISHQRALCFNQGDHIYTQEKKFQPALTNYRFKVETSNVPRVIADDVNLLSTFERRQNLVRTSEEVLHVLEGGGLERL
jgi:hypothetical protein